ncbi:MAG: EscR/YscR/HrcR family type III secretion system export apparatus protein [Myxococcales bacterium]|nr:EscR/YscR/HrcR family type III secretion system export apparatus protein [Myxococcales bacterium]MCB9533164.1 EscR/YscR/HrcR family type III secretion system export apparatus protein [Myxococcales bacterium]
MTPADLLADLVSSATAANAAAAAAGSAAAGAPSPVVTAVLLALLGLVPFAFAMTTSFTKITVVLSLLRSAIGAPNVPPNLVVAALALVLTGFVMAPVATESLRAAEPHFGNGFPALDDLDAWSSGAAAVAAPLAGFLAANSGERELATLCALREIERPGSDAALPLWLLAPAFTLTELSEAFQIGFLVFVPFLLLDLLIGAVLLSLGMHMLSPTAVSMPFKLLLFVAAGGWVTITESLTLGYAYVGGP